MSVRAVRIIVSVSVFVFLDVWVAVADAASVKQSSSGICHVPGSSFYSRVKKYTAYPNLQACIRAGGRLPAMQNASGRRDVKTSAPLSGSQVRDYSRNNFGHGWSDADHDCQNSRHEALIAQSTAPLSYKNNEHCQVVAGRWISVYSGNILYDASDVDIDHLVPLKWAWEHGARFWSEGVRARFANDPVNLLRVEVSLNRQKGAQGPDQWLPPEQPCQYIIRFLRVIKSYQLTLSRTESAAYESVRLRQCGR